MFSVKNVIVQGITGSHGSFHTKEMIEYGTSIVAGVSPKKAGETVHGVPVYSTVKEVLQEHSVDASIIFVPAPFARAAIMEAIDAEIKLIVCITEGIPIHDMLAIKQRLKTSKSLLLGPNSPGLITPGNAKLGIIPASITKPGSVAIVSRSGTLTYEAVAELSAASIGQKYVIGIGGDPIKGLDFIDCLQEFENDPEVTSVVLIGEIGGNNEIIAADFIANKMTKPVVAYIAGKFAPSNVQLGHAGAILGSASESAAEKSNLLQKAGAIVVDSVVDIATAVKENLP